MEVKAAWFSHYPQEMGFKVSRDCSKEEGNFLWCPEATLDHRQSLMPSLGFWDTSSWSLSTRVLLPPKCVTPVLIPRGGLKIEILRSSTERGRRP